jgi:hypothetical protein
MSSECKELSNKELATFGKEKFIADCWAVPLEIREQWL